MAENDDPFRIWNREDLKDDPFAPHNGFDKDNPFKPWNNPFGREEDLTKEEKRDYGIRDKNNRDYDY